MNSVIKYQGRIFTISEHTDDQGNIKEICSRPPSVGVIAITADHNIILLHHRNSPPPAIYFLPSGRADKDNNPQDAAQRELREETGYRAESLTLFLTNFPSNTINYHRLTYIARHLISDPLPRDDDENDLVVVPTPLNFAANLALEGKLRPEIAAYCLLRFQHLVRQGELEL